MGMEVDRGEVELAGDQEDQGADGRADGRQACEAVGALLGAGRRVFRGGGWSEGSAPRQ